MACHSRMAFLDFPSGLTRVGRMEEGATFSFKQSLEEFYATYRTRVAIDEMQFQLLVLFAKLHDGETVHSDHISQVAHFELFVLTSVVQILQIDMSSMCSRDVCLKWQIFTVLSAAGLLSPNNMSGDAVHLSLGHSEIMSVAVGVSIVSHNVRSV